MAPGVRAVVANNPGTVHVQGYGELRHRPRQSRDPRSGAGRRRPYRRFARGRARRDRYRHIRHPHPPRPFAGRAQDQGGYGRDYLRRRPASRGAAAAYRRGRPARCLGRHGFPSRRRARGRRGHIGRRLDHRSDYDARTHRKPHGLCVQGSRPHLFRRPRDGVVDLDRGAARRGDERLHGLTGKAGAAARADLPPRSRRPRA